MPADPHSARPLPVSELRDYHAGWDSQPYEYDYYVDAAYVRSGEGGEGGEGEPT